MTMVRIFCNGTDYTIRKVDGSAEFSGFESYTAAERFARQYGWSIAR